MMIAVKTLQGCKYITAVIILFSYDLKLCMYTYVLYNKNIHHLPKENIFCYIIILNKVNAQGYL